MVFAILAGIVSLMLLALLYFGAAAQMFSALIITVEIGLLLVIVMSVLRIMRVESKNRKLAKNNMDNLLAVKTCPDYWTMQETNNGEKKCKRSYKAPGDVNTTITMFGNVDEIDLGNYSMSSMGSVCNNAAKLGAPWTDVRSVCDAFDVSLDVTARNT
jgi:hypothetical protein